MFGVNIIKNPINNEVCHELNANGNRPYRIDPVLLLLDGTCRHSIHRVFTLYDLTFGVSLASLSSLEGRIEGRERGGRRGMGG